MIQNVLRYDVIIKRESILLKHEQSILCSGIITLIKT